MILFHDGKPEAALEHLAKAPLAPTWAYERLRLEGDIHRSWGAAVAAEGKSDDEARQRLEEALRVYNRASAVAPSHSALRLDAAQTIGLLVQMRLVPPEEIDSLIQRARQLLKQTRDIDPSDGVIQLWTARIELASADHQIFLARDPSSSVARAHEAARQALELGRYDSKAWLLIAQAHEFLARWQISRGQDPSEDDGKSSNGPSSK